MNSRSVTLEKGERKKKSGFRKFVKGLVFTLQENGPKNGYNHQYERLVKR